MKKILFLLSMVVIFSMSACTKSVPEPEGGNTIVDNQVDEVETTEKVTVKPTEKETEKVTEKATEKETESATEKQTEAATEKQTEKQTEKPTQAKPQETKPVHTHSYSNATCTEAAKCSCGTTSGNALGHAWTEATCTSAQSCTRCGATGNAALGHTWTEATCTSAQSCTRCGTTGNAALGHNYSEGKCTRCGDVDSSYVKTYKIGETWVVEGKWEFTINSVTTHYLCNHYANESKGYTDEQVVFIEYSYKNLKSDSLLIQGIEAYDETGMKASSYACTHASHPTRIMPGTSTNESKAFVLNNNSSKILLVVSGTFAGMGDTAKFDLTVN